MKFRTELKASPSTLTIAHDQQLLLLGSCFSHNIGERLHTAGLNAIVNPFGTIFNLPSLLKLIAYSVESRSFSKSEIQEHNGLYHHWDFHSSFNATNPQQVLDNISQAIQSCQKRILIANKIFITIGTAFVYEIKDEIVANCHKVPNTQFTKKLISVTEMYQQAIPVFQSLKEKNPHLEIVLTLSPVRHVKDGVVNNARSKAECLSAIHKIVDTLSYCHYYPAYELMMDDLRDYRYYDGDMLHPNQTAIAYIWQHFSSTYFLATTQKLARLYEDLNRAKNHRSMNPTQLSQEKHEAYITKTTNQINSLLKI